MAEVTYYVALPFLAADDGIAAGEPTECFNPVAVVMRAEALSRKEGHVGAVAFGSSCCFLSWEHPDNGSESASFRKQTPPLALQPTM